MGEKNDTQTAPDNNSDSAVARTNNQSDVAKTPMEKAEVQATGAGNNGAPLTNLARVQTDVIRFATKIIGSERAAEFATRVALIARDNPQLKKAIESNADSFLSAYMASVTLDLMPNTPEQLAYIIPYGNVVQFQVGYKGLIKLARRSGEIKSISAELVFEGDMFRVTFGTDRGITHEPDFDVDRTDYSKVTHAYATAKLTNGEDVFVVMTRKELDKIQKTVKSKSTDTPWQQWPERQAIKTVLKRLTQVLPSSTELQQAVAFDNYAEGGKLKFKDGRVIEGDVVDNEKASAGAKAAMLAAKTNKATGEIKE